MKAPLSEFQRLLKRINRIAGELPPDAREYMRQVDLYTAGVLPSPSPGFIKAHGKVTVYSHLLEIAIDEVSAFERGKN